MNNQAGNKEDDNQIGNKRENSIECTRAICMLWIVCVWHCRGYVSDFIWKLKNPIFNDITMGALYTFVFISGYFLGQKPLSSKAQIVSFYKRRFFHLYLPFVLSCTLFFFMFLIWEAPYVNSTSQYLLSLAGLSLFIPPAPWTIWFVVFMIPCYLITPIIGRSRNKVLTCAIIYACVVVLVTGLKKFFNIESDVRILQYFPIFLLGFVYQSNCQKSVSIVKLSISVCLIVLLELSGVNGDSPYKYAVFGCFIITVLEIGKLLNSFRIISKIGVLLGGVSMEAYLFHRQFFYTVQKIVGRSLGMLQMYLIVVPLFFAILLYYKHLTMKVKGIRNPPMLNDAAKDRNRNDSCE